MAMIPSRFTECRFRHHSHFLVDEASMATFEAEEDDVVDIDAWACARQEKQMLSHLSEVDVHSHAHEHGILRGCLGSYKLGAQT